MRAPLPILTAAVLSVASAHSAAEWRNRTIYQVLTDRFYHDGASGSCGDLSKYCGGTWHGLVEKLDYISALGFDALWITPVVKNAPDGYHGYWAMSLSELNANFGSEEDLKALVQAAHERNMWVMLDVVANHMGRGWDDVPSIEPFNDPSFYHDCSNCPEGCQIQNFNDDVQTRLCRLAGLPDLNQTRPDVSGKLTSWIRGIVSEYEFDGIRIDTVPEVNKGFWSDFSSAAGVFTIGEVFNGDPAYVGPFQGPIDATLSYPMFFTLRNVFAHGQSMNQIQSTLQQYSAHFSDVSVLGSFVDNHDNVRFLNLNGDHTLYKNALAFNLLAQGIPILYYGSEQGFAGGNDPQCREDLWRSNFDETSDLFRFIQSIASIRKQHQVWASPQVQRYSDDTFYAFTRGKTFAAFTNAGSNGQPVSRPITYHPYANGDRLCDLLDPSTCVTVENNQFQVTLVNGMPRVFAPAQQATRLRSSATLAVA